MIWLLIGWHLINREGSQTPSTVRPLPVLMRGPSSRWLWHVRDFGAGLIELSNELDQVVCTYVETSGVRRLRSHPVAVDAAELDAARLDFKLRSGEAAA